MQTRQIVDNFGTAVWSGGPSVGGWKFSYRLSQWLAIRTRNYSDTVRRIHPLDGYMSATVRTTTTSYFSPTVMDMSDSFSYGTKYTNYPVWNMYPSTAYRYASDLSTVVQPPTTSLDRNAMYNSIRKKIHGEATNLANMLGEYRETADTFLQLTQVVLTRGRSLLSRRSARKGLRGNVDVSSTIAKNHLAWNYGIAPLANDMGTAVAELQSAIQAIPLFMQGVESRKDRATNIGFRLPSGSANFGPKRSEMIVETRYRTQWRAYMNQNALLVCLAQHGMLNPLGLAWELMPYSFVLDWWFNVGDILQSLDNLLIVDSLYVLDSSSVRTYEYLSIDKWRNTVYVFQPSFRYDRTDSRRTPVQIPRVSSLQYKPSLSLGHILNGLALLHVAAKRL